MPPSPSSSGSSSGSSAADGSGWAAFRHRDFRLFAAGRFLATMAVQIQNVSVGWLVYDITRDPLALGLVGLFIFLPAISLVLVTGHTADRFDRRSILALCYSVNFLAALGMLAVTSMDIGRAWPVYLLIFVFGTSRAFSFPAAQAIVPNLVPKDHFSNAVAWNSSIFQTATIVGPALGGVLYAVSGILAFGMSAAFFALCSVLLLMIRRRGSPGEQHEMSLGTLFAGIRYIRSHPAIFGAISLDLFAVLLGGATALLPVYARDILAVGPWGLGLLRSMPAVGAVVMALSLARWPLTRGTGVKMFVSVAIFGLATIGFGVSASLPLSLAFLFALGASDMISVFIRQTLVQLETPDEMRGRVSAANSVFIGASNELGEFESGALAAIVGTVPSVVIGGAGTLAVAGVWAALFPSLRRRDRLVPREDEAVSAD